MFPITYACLCSLSKTAPQHSFLKEGMHNPGGCDISLTSRKHDACMQVSNETTRLHICWQRWKMRLVLLLK